MVEDDAEVIGLYLNGYNGPEIADLLHIGTSTVYSILDFYNIDERHNQKLPVNDLYFKNINTRQKAYWLGIFAADGNVSSDVITFGLKDREHVERFKEEIESEHSISKDKGKEFYRLVFTSKEMASTLPEYGITERKGKDLSVRISAVPEEYIDDLWMGLFDGDGGVLSTRPVIYMTGTEDTCSKFKSYMISNGVKTTASVRQNGGSYIFALAGPPALEGLNILYDNPVVTLERKRNLANKWVMEAKDEDG